MLAQSKTTDKAKGGNHNKGRDDSYSLKGVGTQHDQTTLMIKEENRPEPWEIAIGTLVVVIAFNPVP